MIHAHHRLTHHPVLPEATDLSPRVDLLLLAVAFISAAAYLGITHIL